MNRAFYIAMIAGGIVLCSEDAQAQNRNQAKQTISFGVYLNVDSPAFQKTITVAPLAADSKPSYAISLRSLIPMRSTIRKAIPIGEISAKLESKKLLVTISD
ncbi:MAG: hypothetical protein WEB33_02365 [Bacteroidota bacterium]